MLAFDVINLEQYRALQQNAARAHLPEVPGSKLPLIVRSSCGSKLLKLNRQIPELKHPVTHRKQTTQTCSNRQILQKRLRQISKSTSSSSARDLDISATQKMDLPATVNEAVLAKWAPTSNRQWLTNRSYRKQTIKPCLTEARTHIRETAFSCNFQISAAALSCELRFRSEAPRTISQSSNLSETYGRS
jgi:hypothetical protein